MDNLSLSERKKYEEIWKRFPCYRQSSLGEHATDCYIQMIKNQLKKDQTLIDFGCGTGRSTKKFLSTGLRVELIDCSSNCLDEEIVLLTRLMPDRCRFWQACLWELPKELPAAEWGFCCDVLEHIPPAKIEDVLSSMSRLIIKGSFLSIALTEDKLGAQIGQPLHLTLRSTDWWAGTLKNHFQTVNLLFEVKDWAVFFTRSEKN